MIDPALTPEEWADEAYRLGDGELVELDHAGPDRVEIKDPKRAGGYVRVWMRCDRHALAALCMHRQPFGFTWADVDALRAASDDFALLGEPGGDRSLGSLADRIAALLPPRTP